MTKSIGDGKREIVKILIEQERIKYNSKYGKFIIQTNEIQMCLILIIMLKTSSNKRKSIKEYIERHTLGNLIKCFNCCAKNTIELSIIKSLKLYNDSRNALAHRMYTEERLTEKECELSIELGEEILKELKNLLKLFWPMKNNL